MLSGPFGDGFQAPFSVLALLTLLLGLGLLAALLGGREEGRLPLVALAGLLIGAALLEFGVRLPYGGYVIPGALVVVGALIAFDVRLPGAAALAVGVVAALWFGQAGGSPAGDRPLVWVGYAAGAATALAAGIGFAALMRQGLSASAPRLAGAVVALVGILLYFGVL
ncbi:HupE/UreJ family protein [Inquilinus sp. CAU 1745]|uniref:HupE/UreJ family protein n=1 Tax=Inquilinus sp. CAU 1745 TaxID=3140369 RepID=UPI00325AB28C